MATTDKYDRQLRLWGASGQRALGETCVVLIRATAAGTETAKNLILPGIGAVLILDDAGVSTEYTSNFFLQSHKSSRAEAAWQHLQELNPDVAVSWKHTDNLMSFDFATTFQDAVSGNMKKLLVLGSDLEPSLLLKVAAACHSIPLICVHSYGLIGVVRLQTALLPLLNPKPRDSPPDLRLVHPFPELQQFAESIDWSTLEKHQHAHIPYPLILLRLSNEWKITHNGQLPQTLTEKQEFQTSVRNAARNYDTELNFQEAYRNAYTAYTLRELDGQHLSSLMRNSSTTTSDTTTTTATSDNIRMNAFHILLQALDRFVQQHHQQPPMTGSIPDMTASTEMYVQLQTIYQKQVAKDLAEMQSLVASIHGGTMVVEDEMILTFCQNVFSVDMLQTRTIATEYTNQVDDELCEDLSMATMEGGDERPDQLPMLWYLGFRACQSFYMQHGRYPGVDENCYEQDILHLQSYIVEIVHGYNLQDNEVIQSTLLLDGCNKPRYAMELTRYANAEIHNIASVVGGVASQEAVKVITGQYVPINNTYIFNGIASIGAVHKF